MRTLRFLVNQQKMIKDPDCNFSEIVSGTRGYLRADFLFSDEWKGCAVAAVFSCVDGAEAVPVVNGACEVPGLVSDKKLWWVSAVGAKGDYRITSNKVEVRQK